MFFRFFCIFVTLALDFAFCSEKQTPMFLTVLYSSVGIATRYVLDGPGIEPRWGARFSASVQTGPEAHPASYTMGTGSFPGVKRPGRGVEVERRVQLYICSPLWAFVACYRWTFTLTFTFYLSHLITIIEIVLD